MYILNKIKIFSLFLLFLSISSVFAQSSNKFKVVLDAGHGGKDFGTIHHGYIEKKIVLSVTLMVGKLLEKYPDIDVVYTRKKDVFIELRERANIANKAEANLFVSIHCNGVKSYEPFGTETFVMGLTRNATNLEVAKKENSVITLEADYKTKYAGFDPNNPSTLIGLKLLQEENLEQSISLASKIQDNFTNKLERKNRGVKQSPIWVLDATVMPGILIELGFVSNKKEGAYLNSETGQNELAKAIADAILSYKKEYYGNLGQVREEKEDVQETPISKVAENKSQELKEVVFKVQISASGTKLELLPKNFKGLEPITVIAENGLYKYFYAQTSDYTQAKQNLAEAKSRGYDSSFLVAFKNGKKISIQDALKQ